MGVIGIYVWRAFENNKGWPRYVPNGTFIENDVVIGDRGTIKCGEQLWDGMRAEDTYSSAKMPPARMTGSLVVRPVRRVFRRPLSAKGATIGANSAIMPGLRIGRVAIVGAGSEVSGELSMENGDLHIVTRSSGRFLVIVRSNSATASGCTSGTSEVASRCRFYFGSTGFSRVFCSKTILMPVLAFRVGPLHNTTCRWEDYQELKAMLQ